MLLILTNSLDGTTDEIVRLIGAKNVFRFNIDLWRDYEFGFDSTGFRFLDPTGRKCQALELGAAYVRKPTFDDPLTIPDGGSAESWMRAQLSYFIQEVYNWCKDQGIVRLVEKGAQSRFGKFSQLRLAEQYFQVPPWSFRHSSLPVNLTGPLVAKSLTADFVGDYRILFTRSVDPSTLDPTYPWLLQQQIPASHDVTVVFVGGRCFAFALDRSTFEGVDWRKHINKSELSWQPHPLCPEFEERIRGFMGRASLEFGRLDFLKCESSFYFLEVNPNGQWAWLDLERTHGVFDAVIQELTRGWIARPKK